MQHAQHFLTSMLELLGVRSLTASGSRATSPCAFWDWPFLAHPQTSCHRPPLKASRVLLKSGKHDGTAWLAWPPGFRLAARQYQEHLPACHDCYGSTWKSHWKTPSAQARYANPFDVGGEGIVRRIRSDTMMMAPACVKHG